MDRMLIHNELHARHVLTQYERGTTTMEGRPGPCGARLPTTRTSSPTSPPSASDASVLSDPIQEYRAT